MSTSLLYHAFGIRGYDYIRTDYEKKQVTFQIKQNNHSLCCLIADQQRLSSADRNNAAFVPFPS
ncbi:MAG: hypothetical protein P9X24_19055, partial [Candidatus Hatepunaea meridiana]|nr:hypothetical protein [Candidatus Hatepunaea meridiana]